MLFRKKYPLFTKRMSQITWPFVALFLNILLSFGVNINFLFRNEKRVLLLMLSYSGYIYTKRINCNFPLELFIHKLSNKKNSELLDLFLNTLSKKRQLRLCHSYCASNEVDKFFFNYLKSRYPQNYKNIITKSKLSLKIEDQSILEDFFAGNPLVHVIEQLPFCLDADICSHYKECVSMNDIAAKQLLRYGKTGFDINPLELSFEPIKDLLKSYQDKPFFNKAQKWLFEYLMQNKVDAKEINTWLITEINTVVLYFYDKPLMLFNLYSMLKSRMNNNNQFTIKKEDIMSEVSFYVMFHMPLKKMKKWMQLNQFSIEDLFKNENISQTPQVGADNEKMQWLMQSNIKKEAKAKVLENFLDEAKSIPRFIFQITNKEMKQLVQLSQEYKMMAKFLALMIDSLKSSTFRLYDVFKNIQPLIETEYQSNFISEEAQIQLKDFHWYSGSIKLIDNGEKYTKTNSLDAILSLALNVYGLDNYTQINKKYYSLFTEELLFKQKNNKSAFSLAIEKHNSNFLRNCFNYININELNHDHFEQVIHAILNDDKLKLYLRISLINQIKKEINWYDYPINESSPLYPYYSEKAIASEHFYMNKLRLNTPQQDEQKPIKKRNKL